MKRCRSYLMILLLIAGSALAQSWQDRSTQTVRVERWFYQPAGTKYTTGAFRSYISGADTSLAANQINWTFDAAADSCWYILNIAREESWNTYRITGADALIRSADVLFGRADGKGAVDGTAIATGAVTSAAILNGTIATADYAAGSVDGTVLGANAVTSSHIADASIVSADVVDGTLTRNDLAKNAQGRFLFNETSIQVDSIYGYTGTNVFLPEGKLIVGTSALLGEVAVSAGALGFADIGSTTGIDFDLPDNVGTTGQVLVKLATGGSYWTSKLSGVTTIGTGLDTLDVNERGRMLGNWQLGDAAGDVGTVWGVQTHRKPLVLGANAAASDGRLELVDGLYSTRIRAHPSLTQNSVICWPNTGSGHGAAYYFLYADTDTTTAWRDPNDLFFGGTVTLPASKKQIGAYVAGLEATSECNANWHTATPGSWAGLYVFVNAAEDSVEFRTTLSDLSARTIMYQGRK